MCSPNFVLILPFTLFHPWAALPGWGLLLLTVSNKQCLRTSCREAVPWAVAWVPKESAACVAAWSQEAITISAQSNQSR